MVALVATLAAVLTWQQGARRALPSDFAQSWHAARFLVAGATPYEAIGPGRAFDWPFPYLYPLTTAVLVFPVAWLPLRMAEVVFFGGSAGALAWALTRASSRNPQLWLFASWAFLFTAEAVQWSPLIIAAALMPALGCILSAKPTIAAALLVAYPSRLAVLNAAALVFLTVALWPWWVPAWIAALPKATHVVAPITLTGGVFVLLALLKWRRAEARLVVALACVPHTVFLYEALPLFLVVRRWWEGAALSALTFVTWMVTDAGRTYPTYEAWAMTRAQWQLWLLFIPCVGMVLTRPNDTGIESRHALSPEEPGRG